MTAPASRFQKIAGSLALGLVLWSPLAAQSEEETSQAKRPSPITTHEGRQIAHPEQLAPPRPVPLEESLPPSSPELLHLDLRSAMAQVLEQSPSLKKITSRIRQAEYRVQEAYAPALPTLDFSAGYSRVQPPVSFPGGPVISPADNYQFTLTLRQAIFDFGRMKWNVLASKLEKRVIQEEYRAELNNVILVVAQRYIEALLAQERVAIAQDDLDAQLANLRTSQLLYEQGVAAHFDVLRNSAAASQAQQILIEAETSESIAKARLLSLLDQPLDRRLQLDALSINPPNDQLQLSDSKLKALETRPDLRSLRWAVEQARARMELAETSNNPRLDLTNTTVNQNATGFSPETQNTTALVLSVPLFDGGVSHWQKEQANEAVHQLTHDLEQAERDVVLQLDEVHHQLEDRWRAIAVAQENVTQAEEALRVAVLRYENGISTNVELLESQAARARARFELAQARGNYLLSRWNWWQATAGEYPTEVPLPEGIRERLEAEGLPNGMDAFSEETGEAKLGPYLPDRPAPVLPIRGLPTPGFEGDGPSPADSPAPE